MLLTGRCSRLTYVGHVAILTVLLSVLGAANEQGITRPLVEHGLAMEFLQGSKSATEHILVGNEHYYPIPNGRPLVVSNVFPQNRRYTTTRHLRIALLLLRSSRNLYFVDYR
jgi:hypothetical protein